MALAELWMCAEAKLEILSRLHEEIIVLLIIL